MENSLGNPIDVSEEGIVAFWRWFGDSCVVDQYRRPLVTFHGSPDGKFDEFDTTGGTSVTLDYNSALGAHFTEERSVAERFAAGLYSRPINPVVHEVYLHVVRPLCDGPFISLERIHESEKRWAQGMMDYNAAVRARASEAFSVDEMSRILVEKGIDAAFAYERACLGPQPEMPPSPLRRNPLNEAELARAATGRDYDEVYGMSVSERRILGAQSRRSLMERNFDGIFYSNGNEQEGRYTKSWIVFRPEQVKSVHNRGCWVELGAKFCAGVDRPVAAVVPRRI
jgi:hypothetical protein